MRDPAMIDVCACAHPGGVIQREGTKGAPQGTPTFKQWRQRSPRGSQRQEGRVRNGRVRCLMSLGLGGEALGGGSSSVVVPGNWVT